MSCKRKHVNRINSSGAMYLKCWHLSSLACIGIIQMSWFNEV